MLTSDQAAARERAIAGSPQDKEAYMREIYVPHRNFDRVDSEAKTCLTAGTGLAIVMVVGPPGAGKTTFGRFQLRELLRRYAAQIHHSRSFIPATMATLDTPQKNRELNWTLLYSRLCRALRAPSPLDGYTVEQTDTQSFDMLKQAKLFFEAALNYRGLRHLILDEIIYLTASSTEPFYYGEFFKSLANRSGFNLLLLGNYGCERIAVASGALARRVIVLEYPRYKANNDDYKEYCKFVASILPLLPFRFEVDVEEHQQYLFESSIGLPGLTVNILFEACSRCNEARFPRWDDRYLRLSMPSDEAHDQLLKETLIGEMKIERFLRSGDKHNYNSEDIILSRILAEQSQESERQRGK
ncbi:ATPase AAA [Caballeronia pedi]|uniref:ATPase AAA n=1 Tax=Caballeronia pedi TaxID=1777141 RepID=A0A157ZV58_9BURK|nr:ATP-binding protein [Caballeronia pedi]SAK49380.1 ATPase AAA [Caballeronia pedi]